MKDNFLWQLVDFPTRGDDILDFVLTTFPSKFRHIHGFNDILSSDHKLIGFEIDFKIPKKQKIKRTVYDLKCAHWSGFKQTLRNIPWDTCFVPNDPDDSLDNWCDLFVAAVKEHVPMCKDRNVNDLSWIDNELRSLLKKKDMKRKQLTKKRFFLGENKYNELRRSVKDILLMKKKGHYEKMKASILDNPKRF